MRSFPFLKKSVRLSMLLLFALLLVSCNSGNETVTQPSQGKSELKANDPAPTRAIRAKAPTNTAPAATPTIGPADLCKESGLETADINTFFANIRAISSGKGRCNVIRFYPSTSGNLIVMNVQSSPTEFPNGPIYLAFYSAQDLKPKVVMEAYSKHFLSLSPNDQRLAVYDGFEQAFQIFEFPSQKMLFSIPAEKRSDVTSGKICMPQDTAWLDSGVRIAVKKVGSIQIWDTISGKMLQDVVLDESQMVRPADKGVSCIASLFWSPNGAQFLTYESPDSEANYGQDPRWNPIKLWDTQTGKLVREIPTHGPFGRESFVWGNQGVFAYWMSFILTIGDAKTGSVRTIEGISPVNIQAISPNGKWLAQLNDTGINLVELDGEATRQILIEDSFSINPLIWMGNQQLFLFHSGQIHSYNLERDAVSELGTVEPVP